MGFAESLYETMRYLLVVSLVLLGLTGVQADPLPALGQDAPPAVVQAEPGLSNFAQVSPVLYRGGQPSGLGLATLRALGVRTIVDLRAEQNDLHLLHGKGFRYVHMGEIPGVVNAADIAEFLRIVADPANQPVFVHCAEGSDRTGVMVAAYRIVDEGWSAEQAIEEALAFHFHPVFKGALDYLRNVKPDVLRARAAQIPPPNVATP